MTPPFSATIRSNNVILGQTRSRSLTCRPVTSTTRRPELRKRSIADEATSVSLPSVAAVPS
jgi:hypothetical protein